MNNRAIQTLKLLNKYGSMNYYQLKMKIRYKNSFDFANIMFYLMENHYIWYENGMRNKYKFDKNEYSHDIPPLDLFFHLTIDGENKLSEIELEEKKFKINSVIVPIALSIITSFLTAYFTLKLAP